FPHWWWRSQCPPRGGRYRRPEQRLLRQLPGQNVSTNGFAVPRKKRVVCPVVFFAKRHPCQRAGPLTYSHMWRSSRKQPNPRIFSGFPVLLQKSHRSTILLTRYRSSFLVFNHLTV